MGVRTTRHGLFFITPLVRTGFFLGEPRLGHVMFQKVDLDKHKTAQLLNLRVVTLFDEIKEDALTDTCFAETSIVSIIT